MRESIKEEISIGRKGKILNPDGGISCAQEVSPPWRKKGEYKDGVSMHPP